MMILNMGLEVAPEVVDAFGENGYLNERRAGILVVRLVFLNDFLFLGLGNGHKLNSFSLVV